MRKRNRRKPARQVAPATIRNDAAGIDIGATEVYVAVAPDRDPEPVRCFFTFTVDLERLAAWLKECGVQTVAMESTGVYWIPLFDILEKHGFEVCLVNARHVKNVPGRKSDMLDCQWLQYLHAVGLLRASFRPANEICALRALLRHRQNLVRYAASHVQHMQKALDQMNLQLHHVLSDITGLSGLRILDGILTGERDPAVLAKLRDPRVRSSQETIAKALTGNYREEHLFTLRQALEMYRRYQQMIAECDREMEGLYAAMPTKVDLDEQQQPPPPRRKRKSRGDETHFDLRTHCYRVLGTDLTAVPGLGALSAQAIVAEVGTDFQAFPNAAAFSSWAALCPHNDVTGGKIIKRGTRKVNNRLAVALRMAAQSLVRDQSYLGDYHRRMRARLGPAAAVTATAHKLARIIYHLVTTGEAYDEGVFAREQQRQRKRTTARLRARARSYGFDLVPLEAAR